MSIKEGERAAENRYFVSESHYFNQGEQLVLPPSEDIVAWLKQNAAAIRNNATYVLAHALDGVIWGRIENGQLTTGDQLRPDIVPTFRTATLEQVRVFNQDEEWFLWRGGDGWNLRVTRDVEENEKPGFERAFSEYHVLWGTYAAERGDRFTLVEDGMQGLRHLLPIALSDKFPSTREDGEKITRYRACLRVRHYLNADDSGVQSIIRSRLVNVEEVSYDHK